MEQDHKISQGGRQKRKEMRQQVAQQQSTSRRTRQRKVDSSQEKEFEVEQMEDNRESIAESESEEDQNQKEYIRIISDHLIPREKAITKYRQYEKLGEKPYQRKGNKKARWEDFV